MLLVPVNRSLKSRDKSIFLQQVLTSACQLALVSAYPTGSKSNEPVGYALISPILKNKCGILADYHKQPTSLDRMCLFVCNLCCCKHNVACGCVHLCL